MDIRLDINAIERRRRALGLTQAAAAERAKISPQLYSRVKLGKSRSPETVRAICLALDIDPAAVWVDGNRDPLQRDSRESLTA